jgi:hypothetical protein
MPSSQKPPRQLFSLRRLRAVGDGIGRKFKRHLTFSTPLNSAFERGGEAVLVTQDCVAWSLGVSPANPAELSHQAEMNRKTTLGRG